MNHDVADSKLALWVGALITDKAKIEDVVEANYSMPSSMLDGLGRAAYERGVQHAECSESALIKAVKAFALELKVTTPSYDKARQHFWTRVEQGLSLLFDAARNLTAPNDLAGSPWGLAVRAAMHDAYDHSCPCQTPRQIQAFALGLRRLNSTAQSKTSKPTKADPHE